MTSVRLPKLPDRTPLRVAIHLMPELHRKLEDYVAAYEATYGQKVSLADLIPAMLDGYLDSDRAFSRRKK